MTSRLSHKREFLRHYILEESTGRGSLGYSSFGRGGKGLLPAPRMTTARCVGRKKHPRRRTVRITKSATTATTRSSVSPMETARIVPRTKATMVASVIAAAPRTATKDATIHTAMRGLPGRVSLEMVVPRGLRFYAERPREPWSLAEIKLVDSGPIVGYQNRITWIRRIILHAGRLAGSNALQAKPPLETPRVVRSLVGDTGNRVAVSH